MNIFTYLKQVVILALFLPFSVSLKSQCSQPNGTILVTSAADEGVGSLRAAINCANTSVGTNRIIFNIPSNDRAVILVGSTSGQPLPNLEDAGTIIDGTSQTGFGTNGNFEPKVVLDGSVPTWNAPINALKIFGNEAEIYGLEIRNFPDDGIDIDQADNVIIGDYEKGNVIYNCGLEQDFFPETGNSGPYNGVGIVVSNNAENTAIISNIIGTDYQGNANLGNEWTGIYIRFGADFTLIEGNIITDNEIGVRIRNAFGIQITENELSCNSLRGIEFVDGGNDDKAPPVITEASNVSISGTGSVGNEIELFVSDNCADSPCQGQTFLGRAVVQNDRTWTLTSPFANNFSLTGNEQLTATATDANSRTSTFSNCQNVVFETTCVDANGGILVTNTNDDGVGSFRAAIDCANNTPGPNTIRFNINGGGRQQINVGATTGAELPFLRDAGTIIDATTQPGFGQNGNFQPLIILDGSANNWTYPHNALWLRADNCEIYGLEIRNFPDDGIDVTAGDFNIIGAPNKGNVVYNCGSETDFFEDTPTTGPGNGCGLVLKTGAQNTIVQSKYVGTDYSQSVTIGNELCGIIVQNNGNNNQIGGTGIGEGNIIAYNLIGINIRGGAFNNQIQGNQFFCNANVGISLSGNANNNQAAPSINIASVAVINGTGVNGDIIEIYATSSNCADGPCQGNTLVGRATVTNQTWRLTEPFLNNYTLLAGDKVTAISTSSANNTSEFAECRAVGGITPPTECNMGLIISDFSNETCAGNDGTFTLSATNATLPISYDDGDGLSDSPIFSNLNAGVYRVVATDAAGCSVTLSVAITQQAAPSLSVISTNNENCGATNGSVTLSAAGDSGPFIYELSNGLFSRTPSFNDLEAGTYTATVSDANNCTASQTFEIQRIGNINVSIADMRSDNCNSSNGSFRISPSGGQAPYTFDLGNGAVSSNVFSGLSSGTYTVTVADANNCSTIANVQISGSSAPSLAIDNVVPTSCASPTGSISLSANGGTGPYQYNIGQGNRNNPVFSNLAAGNYTLTVTDAINCSATQNVTIEEPIGPSLSIISSQNAACGNANGTVSVLSSGGRAPYLYDIGWGITTDPNFVSLSEGNYTVTVTDNNGCQDEMSVVIADSPTPTVAIENVQDASCNLNNAIVTVAATGTAPFIYDIGSGPVADPTFSNLAAGNYTITLTDNNNCSASVSVEIESAGGPQVNILNTSEASCDKDNGSFSVSALGGFAPYNYDIGNGPTTNAEFRNLAGGNYVVTLTDDNGCTATQSVTLGNVPAPTFGIGNIVDASCGAANGGFNVSAFGGIAPYEFNIGGDNTSNPVFTDLPAGTYTVVVTDANNCSTALGVTVEGIAAPALTITENIAANCGQNDGSFTADVAGGVAPYFFDIGNGETSISSFSNLAPGNYPLTVTDARGCSLERAITIEGSGEINLAIKNQLPAACGAANGTFTLSPSGGQSPYTFQLNNQDFTDSVFTNLSAGAYNLVARDVNGCSITKNIEIGASEGPSLSVEVNKECGNAVAEIVINAEQGQAPYTYDIGNGPLATPVFSNVRQGLYRVTVKDANGCENTKAVVVNISNVIPEATATISNLPACGATDGKIDISVTAGVPPYLYTINDKEQSPFPTFSNLGAGNYTIRVTDAGGCSTSVPVTLASEEGMPSANFELSFNDLEATFTNRTEGGVTYTWDFGDGNAATNANTTHAYTAEGTYTICLTATNDCGEDTYCEAYTIEAINTNKSFEFDFGEINGQVGETIKVPVYVKNFKSIVGFQKSVHLTDTSVAKIVGITDINLADLSVGLFNLKDYHYSVAWFEGNVEGLDLPDSTILYQIELELLQDQSCAEIVIKDTPLPTQVYQKLGNDEIEVAYFQRTGEVCVGGSSNGETARISGLIATEQTMPVSQVTVNCTNTNDLLTKEDGIFLFEELPIPNKYVITPSKTSNPLNGVSTFDLVVMQNHILGNSIIDSPYKLIAADVNQSGAITVSDVLELRRLLIRDINDFINNTSWRFVPTDYEFVNPTNPLKEDIPSSVTLNLSDKNLSTGFVAIKIGDVTDNALPNLVQNESRNNKEQFIIQTQEQFLQKGEITEVFFQAEAVEKLAGLQYTLQLNTEFLSIESIANKGIIPSDNIGQSLKSKGYLMTSWVKENAASVANNDLFSIKVKASKAGKLSELLQINSDYLQAEAYDEAGNTLAITLVFSPNIPSTSQQLELFQNKPNPFSQSTVITYQLPAKGLVQLDIYDIQGRLLKSISENGKKGINRVMVNRTALPVGGVLYYKLNSPFGQATKKMLVID